MVGLVLQAALAFAQSNSGAIAGVVTDSSGAVMPGVTVEATSPALIEQSRTVVTNEAGRYSILSLRPGMYGVTFTLAGFVTVAREGVELTSDFTAQVNAQMKIGGLEESVTVQAASPVVDVQGTAAPRVLTRETMDALPTSRTVQGLANTIPGAGMGNFGQIAYRGSTDSLTTVDGMRTTLMTGAGPSNSSSNFNNAMYQEFSFSTAIDSAEMGQPGFRINLVPRDGGNQFHGSLYTVFTHDGWQNSNLTEELRNPPLNFEDAKTLKLWDVNPSFGGPIMRDRLWFHTTFRSNGSKAEVVDYYEDADPSPFRYEPDQSRPGSDEDWAVSGSARLTWQATPKDKIAGFYDRPYTKTPFYRSPLLGTAPPPDATVVLISKNTNIGVRWTRTHTSRLLFELGFSKFNASVFNDYRGAVADWSPGNVVSGLPTGPPAQYAVLDRNRNRQIGVANIAGGNDSKTTTMSGSATYVTGSHSLKSGFTFFGGSYHRPQVVAGHVVLNVFNNQPESVTLTLPGSERDDIDGDWAFYIQDRWSIKRMTVNLGLRYDWLMSSVPEQVLPANPWLGETRFDRQSVLNFKDLSPRLGAVYDVFGNGKTALKVALARYVAGETVALTGAANPIRAIASTDTRSWNDANGDQTIYNPDGSVQWNELGPSNNLNFGRPVPGTTYDPSVLSGWFQRGYSWETNVGVQHELLPRVAVSALYYRRWNGNQRVNDNQLIGPEDYDEFCITTPVDSRLPGGGGQRVCGLYDLKPSARGLVSNFNTYAKNLGTGRGFTEITSGYELTVNARFPNGAFLQGGLNLNRFHANAQRTVGGLTLQGCDVIDTPETRFCETTSPLRPDVKISGAYTLPWQVQVAGTYQGLSGPEALATLPLTSASLSTSTAPYFSSLGRPLTSGTTKQIPLLEPGETFLSMRHLFDLRFSKTFQLSGLRVQPMVDFYNLFNSSAVTRINNTYGPAWQRPIDVVSGRQFRLGAQVDF